jgi:hypothetical protein
MKNILFFYFLLLFHSAINAQTKASIGMNMDEVKKLYPQTKSSTYENTITLSFNDTLYGLPGEWGYRFKNNQLEWIHFDKYFDEINKTNFDKCLTATKKVITDYTKAFGKPDTTIIGDTTFVDPYVKHHWGYDVIETRWNNYKGMKIKMEFTFLGGKGEYNFLVKINYFDKSYPYFD